MTTHSEAQSRQRQALRLLVTLCQLAIVGAGAAASFVYWLLWAMKENGGLLVGQAGAPWSDAWRVAEVLGTSLLLTMLASAGAFRRVGRIERLVLFMPPVLLFCVAVQAISSPPSAPREPRTVLCRTLFWTAPALLMIARGVESGNSVGRRGWRLSLLATWTLLGALGYCAGTSEHEPPPRTPTSLGDTRIGTTVVRRAMARVVRWT